MWGAFPEVVISGARGSRGDDALSADGTRHGDRADPGEGAVVAGAELVHGSGRAGLDVEVASVGRGGRVDGAGVGGGLAESRQGAGAADPVARQVGAARVRGVDVVTVPYDPAGRLLPGGDLVELGEPAVTGDGEGRDVVQPGLGHDEVTPRVEGETERRGTRLRVHDGLAGRAAAAKGEDVATVTVPPRGDHELRSVGGEADLGRGAAVLGQTEAALPAGHPHQTVSGAREALDGSAAQAVEDVHEATPYGDAVREATAGGDDLGPCEPGAVDREHRDGAAAGVDRVQQAARPVVGQRTL